jgi:hypothetical protein
MGRAPHPSYVMYAFGRATPTAVHFFMVAARGDKIPVAEPSVRWQEMVVDGDTDVDAAKVTVAGITTLLCTVPVRRNFEDMIDRVAVLEFPTPLGPYTIAFDWTAEPPVLSE